MPCLIKVRSAVPPAMGLASSFSESTRHASGKVLGSASSKRRIEFPDNRRKIFRKGSKPYRLPIAGTQPCQASASDLLRSVEPFYRLCDAGFFCSTLQELGGEIMADVIIRALKSGPYEVSGGAKVFDHQGKEFPEDQLAPIYLCRCGQSKNKPFCDGSHADTGFKAEEIAS